MVLTEKKMDILPALRERHSAFAFDERPVDAETLAFLFEAARRAPSSFNEQPWRYWVGSDANPEFRERLRGLLMEGNAWAKEAPVLILSGATKTYARNGNPNRHAGHDLGAANLALMVQAQHLGLASHPMGGFDAEAAAELIGDPNIEPFTMIAVGYPGDLALLPDDLKLRAETPSPRHSVEQFVFGEV